MAAVAVPRYLDSIANAEESAEDAVISAIRNGLKQYANNALVDGGRATWPTNPFDALSEKPAGYSTDDEVVDTDGEWRFVEEEMEGAYTGYITHQRADNSRFSWDYDKGTQDGDDAAIGTLGERQQIN